MDTIHVTMTDTMTGKEVTREIDYTNFLVQDGGVDRITTDPEVQHGLLMEWIEDRANEQHDTTLALVSWYTK